LLSKAITYSRYYGKEDAYFVAPHNVFHLLNDIKLFIEKKGRNIEEFNDEE
jgi:Mor family transcriptional regulator